MSGDKGKLMTDGINALNQSELKQPIMNANKNKPQFMTGYPYARTAYDCPHRVKEKSTFNFVGITTQYNDIADQKITLNKNIVLPTPYVIKKDNGIPLTFSREVTYHRNVPKLDNISNEFDHLRKLTLRVEISRKKPLISWVRGCDFLLRENNAIPKYYQVLENRCMINQVDEATAQFIGEKLACYGYQEIYQKNDTENNQCKELRQNLSCSQGKIICTLYDEKNYCTQQQISYECETSQHIHGYQCGNTFYKDCKIEDCNQSEKSKNFSDAISKLQAIT